MGSCNLRSQLYQALCCQDRAFRNEVVGALVVGRDLLLELPVSELGIAPGQGGELVVQVAVRGRTSKQLIVEVRTAAGQVQPKLVAVHYTKLLQYASLESLMALAFKVQVMTL